MKKESLKNKILRRYNITKECKLKGLSGVEFNIHEYESEHKVKFHIITRGDFFVAHVTDMNAVFQCVLQYEKDQHSRYTETDLECA